MNKNQDKIIILLLVAWFAFPGSGLPAVNDYWLEAEAAELTGVSKATSYSGYSGTGYVGGFDNETDKITFSFEATAGLYELFIGFCTPHGEKGYELTVNGNGSTGMLPGSSIFKEISGGKVLLVAGKNTIIIANGWGWYYIDYIRLTPAVTYPPAYPQQDLTDSLATGDAKQLFSLLKGLYGKKVLSGQHDIVELEYIKSVTGHTPVVAGFDLIEYSPSRIEHGSNPEGSSESWIAWEQEKHCIINLLWHWNAPTDLIDTPGKEWWRGFYTEATTFDIAATLADTTSARYGLVIRDIDAIAVQLKKFDDHNIPVLWRPLHEASGGWFWWGAKGPEPFIELWRLLYNRLVRYHQLHNLIWVYTSGDPEWYPGDEVVDIASLDIYSTAGSSMSADWENAQTQYNGRKIVALSESGTLPVPEKIRVFNTWWSWFALWTGSFIRGADTSEMKALYNDNDILTLEKMGDWRTCSSLPGQLSGSRPAEEWTARYNQANGNISIDGIFYLTGSYSFHLYDMQGHLILCRSFDFQTPGPARVEIPAGLLPPGLYIAVISNHGPVAAVKLAVIR
jgi:mannan endo-1,4-beta-mannosidase